MTTTTDYHQLTLDYIHLFQDIHSSYEALRVFYDDAVVWQEMPNLFAPMGRSNTLEGLAKSWQKGREAVPHQEYTVRQITVEGNSAVVELDWHGTLTQALGELAAGTIMRSRVVLVIEFFDGKIIRQRDYICYYPLTNVAG